MTINLTFLILALAFIVLIVLIYSLLKIENRTKLHKHFIILDVLFCIHILGLALQILLSNTNIRPIYFEYITYIGAMYTAVEFMMIAILFKNKNADTTKAHWLYLVPTILLLILWTNDFHHLFYIEYSTTFAGTVYGPMLYVFMVYSYTLVLAAFIMITIKTVKQSGFFSIQTALVILGALVPVVFNAFGALRIIPSNVYIMPITYTVTAVCFYIAIIRLKALNVIPVTLKAIVDNMSDAFVVISEDGTIADLNKTFIEKFKAFGEIKDKDNLFKIIKASKLLDLDEVQKDIAEAVEKEATITKEYHIQKDAYERYFEVDFQPVKSKDGTEYVATLILLRDITTAKKDMEMMLKNESLVMLGELAGGVAHDINTPISAIKSGLLMFKTIAKSDDEKMLVERMDSCADKIVTLTNSLRNQIRNIGSNDVSEVNVTAVVKDVAVIIHNELTKNKVTLNLDIKKDLVVKGNSAKLSQVITNIVVNAIQAYENKGGIVNLVVDKVGDNAIIFVEDFAGGIPENIRDNIGKNILTTKGVSGTGFGLYLAYSVITGAFGGEITFDTQEGHGTTFYIKIPMKRN